MTTTHGATPHPPALEAFIGTAAVLRLTSRPPIAPRAWQLGVLAVRLTVEHRRLRAELRAHQSGASAPTYLPLAPGTPVHVALLEDGAPAPSLPALAPGPLGPACARLELFVAGACIAAAALAPALSAQASRAFGHVFCRWLRDGGYQAGCDLTDFLSRPEGAMYERLIVHPVEAGQVVSYVLSSSLELGTG